MPAIENHIAVNLIEGWHVTHLIHLDHGWQCNITDGEHVAVGTGPDIAYSIAAASDKALNGETVGRLFSLGRVSAFADTETVVDLRSLLGLNRPKVTVNRRI